MAKWPKDNQTALIKFYGNPGTGEVGDQLVKVKPPFKMYYDGKLLNTISFHKKAAPELLSALTKCWDYYDRDQATIDKLGISKTAGTYNPRKVRGSATKWSNHAYGAAIDINAEENGFNVTGNIPLPMIAAFKSEGFRWGGDYKGRKDPMHFEACDSGEPTRTFDAWLAELGAPPKAGAQASLLDHDFASDSPKSTADKGVIALRTAGGGLIGVGAVTQGISSVVGPVAEQVGQVKEIVSTGGQVVDVTTSAVKVVPSGFWSNALNFIQSPKFLTALLVLGGLAWFGTWYLRTRKESA